MEAHKKINQDSGKVEYYTPQNIIEAARLTMGSIDLDVASSTIANQRVRATAYFTDHARERDWYGNVWMNHPFSKTENGLWINKLVTEVVEGRVKQACCITFAATSERWFQPLLAQPQCFLCPRTNYHLPDGTLKKGVTKGSVVTYFGSNVSAFRKHFAPLGVVKEAA